MFFFLYRFCYYTDEIKTLPVAHPRPEYFAKTATMAHALLRKPVAVMRGIFGTLRLTIVVRFARRIVCTAFASLHILANAFVDTK